MANELFKRYYSRLAKEGWLKAVLCGLLVGFSAMLISAGIFWMTGFKMWWICLIICAVLAGASTPIFYHKLFRPTTKAMAKRVDMLGLEERLITMTELEGDTSFMAMKQREDTLMALKSVDSKFVKLAVSVPLIIAISVVAFFSTGMTTVSALYSAGVIKSGTDVIEDLKPPKQFELNYEVKGEGMVEGNISQIVEEGKDAEAVMAVPDDNWVFIQWSDGSKDPYRLDKAVSGDITVTAEFAELEDGEPQEGEDGDEQNGEDQGDQPSSGDPTQAPPSEDPSDGAGGNYEDHNQIIDGETYYGDKTFDNAHDDAMEQVGEDGDLSGGLKDIISDYYDTIQK